MFKCVYHIITKSHHVRNLFHQNGRSSYIYSHSLSTIQSFSTAPSLLSLPAWAPLTSYGSTFIYMYLYTIKCLHSMPNVIWYALILVGGSPHYNFRGDCESREEEKKCNNRTVNVMKWGKRMKNVWKTIPFHHRWTLCNMIIIMIIMIIWAMMTNLFSIRFSILFCIENVLSKNGHSGQSEENQIEDNGKKMDFTRGTILSLLLLLLLSRLLL